MPKKNKAQEVQKRIKEMMDKKQGELAQINDKKTEAQTRKEAAELAIQKATEIMDLEAFEEAKQEKHKAQTAIDMYSGRYKQLAAQEYISEAESDRVIDELLPYEQDLGADFVVESLTKFINGHGDALGGAIISNNLAEMDRIRYEAQVNAGGVISPFNAWQIMRGAVTFPLRMQKINETSQKVAEWLEQRAGVMFVSYPGLASNPGHAVASKQMKNGFGGVISFCIDADDRTVERFCAALKIITFAVSLGHDESLIFPQPSYDERIDLYPEQFRNGFIRFSIGLEEPEDIIEDLDQALKSIGL